MYGPCIYAAVGLDGALLLLGPAALLLLLGRSQHLTQHALEVLPGTQRVREHIGVGRWVRSQK